MDDISTLTAVIGTNINEVRSQRALTFDQLAKLSGVSKGMLVQIEQGKTNPSIGTLCKIANALGVAVSKFIETSAAPAVRAAKDKASWMPPASTGSGVAARLAVVDPRRTGHAHQADHWLGLRPGTDSALALGLAQDGCALRIEPRAAVGLFVCAHPDVR